MKVNEHGVVAFNVRESQFNKYLVETEDDNRAPVEIYARSFGGAAYHVGNSWAERYGDDDIRVIVTCIDYRGPRIHPYEQIEWEKRGTIVFRTKSMGAYFQADQLNERGN